MNITEKALVSCEWVDGVTKTEIKGSGEKVLYLIVRLLATTALNISEAGCMGMTDPERIIKATCVTATTMLKDIGGE